MANIQELVRVYDHIINNPKEWDQTAWGKITLCGTRCCFAGTAILLSGKYDITWDIDGALELNRSGDAYEYIPDEAAKVLGLTRNQTTGLFAGVNCIHDIKGMIENWAEEQGESVELKVPDGWICKGK